jgi:Zn-dependent protease
MNRTEFIHILISVITISLAFSLAFIQSFPLVFFTVGLGFIMHEMGHRAVAKRFGCIAQYRAWMEGLVLALIMAFATGGRFIFAAPGAVYIYKPGLTRRENGMISAAGPMMNILLGVFFLWFFMGTSFPEFAQWGFKVNMFLALFNLVPFGPLDGAKVLEWNRTVWAIMFIPLLFLNFFL